MESTRLSAVEGTETAKSCLTRASMEVVRSMAAAPAGEEPCRRSIKTVWRTRLCIVRRQKKAEPLVQKKLKGKSNYVGNTVVFKKHNNVRKNDFFPEWYTTPGRAGWKKVPPQHVAIVTFFQSGTTPGQARPGREAKKYHPTWPTRATPACMACCLRVMLQPVLALPGTRA